MNTRILIALFGLIGCFLYTNQAISQDNPETYSFSQAELDQTLAPIALYPDTILSHILIAATYPLEVIQAERWTRENTALSGDAALNAVESKDWDPSVKALVPFPQILQKMSDDLEWMQKLGDAFLQNEELVLASIQDLRQRAYEEGSLEDLEHLRVSNEDEHIVIEPATREVVYVPWYDTRVVYGPWWWVDYPPVYWRHHHHHYSSAHVYWGPSVYVGHGFYFSGFHWHNRHIVTVDRRYARRHGFHSGRQVVRTHDARRWVHNTRHRRGVEYRHPRMQNHVRHPQPATPRHAQQLADRIRHNTSRTAALNNRHDSAAHPNRHSSSTRALNDSNNATRTSVPALRNPNNAARPQQPKENKWKRPDKSRSPAAASTPKRVLRPAQAAATAPTQTTQVYRATQPKEWRKERSNSSNNSARSNTNSSRQMRPNNRSSNASGNTSRTKDYRR